MVFLDSLYPKPPFRNHVRFPFLRLRLALRFVCGKYPKVPVTLPLRPSFLSFLRIIFKIPAVPLASNLEEGLVITSILSIWSAGMLCSALAPSSIPSRAEGLPFIKNFTLELPLIETVPSVSTEIEGTFDSTSCRLPPLLIMSWFTS